MDSDTSPPPSVEANAAICRSSKGKGPRRTNKAEREKLKREHLNELFLELASVLELTPQNNGKASILNETTRLLKDLFSQIQSLEKENESLLSESHYVTVEKNELKEENSVLETQIEELQNEIKEKSNIILPPFKSHQSELISHIPPPSLGAPAAVEQAAAPAVIVVPFHHDLEAYPDTTQPAVRPTPHVSKPHARYPTPADQWPFELLGEQIKRKEIHDSTQRHDFGNL